MDAYVAELADTWSPIDAPIDRRDVERAPTIDPTFGSREPMSAAAARDAAAAMQDTRSSTLLDAASEDYSSGSNYFCLWRTCRVLPLKPVLKELQARRDFLKMADVGAARRDDEFSTPSKSSEFEIMLDIEIENGDDRFKRSCPSLIARAMLSQAAKKFGDIDAERIVGEIVSDRMRIDVIDAGVVDSEIHTFKQAFQTAHGLVVPYMSRTLENRRIVLFARLATPMFDSAIFDGDSSGDTGHTRFVSIVLTGESVAPVKNAYATSHSMATLLSDDAFVAEAMRAMDTNHVRFAVSRFLERKRKSEDELSMDITRHQSIESRSKVPFMGISADVKRRAPWYASDWKDGFTSWRGIASMLSTTIWIFSTTIVPCLALGLSLQQTTARQMSHVDFLLSEALCNIIFSLVGGQAVLVLRTTGPTVSFINVMYYWCESLGIADDFLVFFAVSGFYAGIMIIIFSIFNGAELMLCINRFTSEQLALFVSVTFIYSGFSAVGVMKEKMSDDDAAFLKYLMLHIGTVALAFKLLAFRTSRSIRKGIRIAVSDVAPVFVVASMTLLSFALPRVSVNRVRDYVPDIAILPTVVRFRLLDVSHWALAMLPAFLLALQVVLETNIAAMLTNRAENKVIKGSAYNLDMFVVGVLMIMTSIFGLPPSIPALPHSHMHARSLAKTTDSYRHGVVRITVYETVETRVTNFAAHIFTLIVACFLRAELIGNIPIATLSGFLVYMGLSSVFTNGLLKRIFVSTVVPVRFLRRVPKKIVYKYTTIQAAMFGVIFACRLLAPRAPAFAIFYPALLGATIPVAYFVLPKLLTPQYARVLATHIEDENLVGLFY